MKVKLYGAVIIVALLLVGCGHGKIDATNVDIDVPFTSTDNEITFITNFMINENTGTLDLEPLNTYGSLFEKKTGVKVTYINIEANNYDDFIRKRNILLYKSNGPTLILMNTYPDWRLVDNKAVLNIEEAVINYENLYDSLKTQYFIPVSISARTYPINRLVIEQLDIALSNNEWNQEDYFNITVEEYFSIFDQWLQKSELNLDIYPFLQLRNRIFYGLEYINQTTGKLELGRDEIIDAFIKLREEVFSGKFIIDPSYNYDNFHNMMFDVNSNEGKKAFQLYSKDRFDLKKYIHDPYPYNLFSSAQTSQVIKDPELLFIPSEADMFILGRWVAVNRNGSNADLGIEFLNYLISDEVQMDMYKTYIIQRRHFNLGGYVIKSIEELVDQMDRDRDLPQTAINLRKHMYDNLNAGKYNHLGYKENVKMEYIRRRITQEQFKIVFSDTYYTRDQILESLKRLESELNIYLME